MIESAYCLVCGRPYAIQGVGICDSCIKDLKWKSNRIRYEDRKMSRRPDGGFNCSICGYPIIGKVYALDPKRPTQSVCHKKCGHDLRVLKAIVKQWRRCKGGGVSWS
jgi:hypothetical protein